MSARGSPAHPRAARRVRGLFVRPIGFVTGSKSQALVPRCWQLPFKSFVRAPGPSWRLSAIPHAPFGGGPHPLTFRSPASSDSPKAPRHTASSHYIWLTVTPRFDPRDEGRHPCALRPPTHPGCFNWRRLPAQNWRCFFARYQCSSFSPSPWWGRSTPSPPCSRPNLRCNTSGPQRSIPCFGRFPLLPGSFRGEVFGVRACGQVTTEAHCNRPGCDFGQPRRNDDAGRIDCACRIDCAGQTRCKGERHSQTVRHADHDVPDGFRGREVLLDVRCLRHRSFPLDHPA